MSRLTMMTTSEKATQKSITLPLRAPHQLLEDHVIGDAGAVGPERMARLPLGYQSRKLLPDGLDEVRSERGHEHPPSSGSLGILCPLSIEGRSLSTQAQS